MSPQTMNKIISKVYFVILLALASCATEPIEETIDSRYILASWTVNIPIDLNQDGVYSLNLLDEIACNYNEELVFNSLGDVVSNGTFNPQVNVVFNKFSEDYHFSVDCDTEGSIGLATNYTLSGDKVLFSNKVGTIKGDELILVFKKAVNIYNQDFSRVLEEKDLTLVYRKQ